jgi:hypothetical protein
MLMLQIPYGSPEVFVGVIPSSPSRVTISDPYDYDGFCGQQSFIMTSRTSITLPSWLVTELSGMTAGVTSTAEDSSGTSGLAGFSRLGTYPHQAQGGVALGNGGTEFRDGYEKTITF